MSQADEAGGAAGARDGRREGDAASVDAAEIGRFGAMADTWWDANGPMRPLHQMAPVRIAFVRDHAAAAFGRDVAGPGPVADRPFAGLSLLDVGCGGGLMCEPMTRLGFAVTGIDAAERNIAVAQHHAGESGLAIDYEATTVEALAAAGPQFDVVLALEVVEHVADLDSFLRALVQVVKPDGIVILSTLNRTSKAFALAVVGAEYVLRWLPRGTHDWRKFVRPSELAAGMRRAGARVTDLAGLTYNPFAGRWSITRDLAVNYFAVARRA
ncbi:MAG: bifunctional 2-polyprenyl-6-hydroxyphenol methylase/3-demethylubiquinol 3-O-methyltransferase UbiG [Rhodospirillaceae bacterium]|nr:bifunctional 2-polyprenyl-6-hydroxyphenol methylase/3-demethylubiquinol 3-O-methyltransferase UbiG [Rhodospirillaceae bacterium]